MEELIKQTDEGDAEAQFRLGMAYYNGNGISKNYSKAYYWLQKAVGQGNNDAQIYLGNLMKIHVLIDSVRYPMIIKRTDEFQYREAAKLLNERLNVYRESYQDIGAIKQWAMTAYDFAFEAITYKAKNDTKPYKDKLEELGKQLDEYLK